MVNRVLFSFVLAAVALLTQTSVVAQNTPRQATALVVEGNVENRLSLGVADLRRSIVVATATDGYMTVFSWAEIFLSPIGDGAMVVFERDGALWPRAKVPSRSYRSRTRSRARAT